MKKTLTVFLVVVYGYSFSQVDSRASGHSNDVAVPLVFTSSNLPIVIINTNGIAIPDNPKIKGTMGIIDNGQGLLNQVTDTPNDYNGKIGIEMRGAYSQSLPQKPYNFETRDASDVQQDVLLLGMPSEHDWCLIANYNDKVFMRNTLAYRLFNQMGHYASRTRFCEVVVNGGYQGIYILMETVKRDSNRVDIAKLEVTENSGLDVTGGYIIKNDYWDQSNSWLSNYHPVDHPTFDVHMVYHYPKPADITTQQKVSIQNFMEAFETTLYSTNYTDPVNGYRKYIGLNSFVDYLIVNELARNNDGFKKSSFFHKDKDSPSQISKLKAGPVWDFDWAWKNIDECSLFSATDGSGWAHHINDCYPDVNSPGWYVRFMQDPNFRNTFRCRWETFRSSILSDASLNNYIDSMATYLGAAQERHFEKWQNLGVNTGAPEVDTDPSTFTGQITKFKNWIALRVAWLEANIPGNAGCIITSVNENKNSLISIYPNPTDKYLYVSTENVNSFAERIELCDVTGRTLMQVSSDSKNATIDVSGLSNGIYFCKFVIGNTVVKTERVVVIH